MYVMCYISFLTPSYISYTIHRVVAQLCDSIDALMSIDSFPSTTTTGGSPMTTSDGQSDPETVGMMRVDDPMTGGDSSSSGGSKFVVLIAATNK